MKPEINIFLISDNHFNHWNINKYCNRGFNSLAEMNTTMIKKWNNIVRQKDIVIIVGDLVFTKGDSNEIKNIIKVLNGRKILVKGNHDRKSNLFYLTNGIDFICEKFEWNFNNKKILFIHNPHLIDPIEFVKYKYIIHGHQHNAVPFIQKKQKCICVNVSTEHINYTPLNLITLLNKLKQGYHESY